MVDIVVMAVIVAMIAAFVLTLLYKWGVVEYLQIHGPELIAKMASCDFCMSFWTCTIVSSMVSLMYMDFGWMMLPFVSTKITQKFL